MASYQCSGRYGFHFAFLILCWLRLGVTVAPEFFLADVDSHHALRLLHVAALLSVSVRVWRWERGAGFGEGVETREGSWVR